MSEANEKKEIVKIVGDISRTLQEVKSIVEPLIQGQDHAIRTLDSHEEAIRSLMDKVIGTREDHKRSIQGLEMISYKVGRLEERFEAHAPDHKKLEKRLRAIEHQQIEEIRKKLLQRKPISKPELRTLENVIEVYPENEVLLGIKGEVLKSMGKKQEALKWIEDSIIRYPKNGYLWYVKGFLLEEPEKALECLDKSLELFEESDKLDRHLAYYAKATVLVEAHRLEEALLSAEKAIEFQSSCAAGWSRRGHILLELNRVPEALGAFEKAIELSPQYWECWYGKGIIMTVLGSDHYDEAIACFDKAIELRSEEPTLYFLKGEVLARMGKLTQALNSFEEGLKRDPSDSCAWCFKGNILAKLGQHGESLDSFDKSLKLGPPDDCTDVRLHKGMVLVGLERIPEAKDLLRSLDQNKIDDALLLNNYAWALYKIGEFRKGVEVSRKAIEKETDDAYFWDTLACNLQGAGLDSEALEAFEKAIGLGKTDEAISWGILAELYERMGRHEEADRAKQKLRKKNSKG